MRASVYWTWSLPFSFPRVAKSNRGLMVSAGVAVGLTVGITVGVAVGDGLGVAVGGEVGVDVGLDVGVAEGLLVGAVVGIGDCFAVGLGLAIGLGLALAVGDGIGEGFADGIGLGAGVVGGSSTISSPAIANLEFTPPPSAIPRLSCPSETVVTKLGAPNWFFCVERFPSASCPSAQIET